MIILGIDPGLATIGYGVIDVDKNGKMDCLSYGCIKTESYHSLSTRLRIIYEDMKEIIEKYSPKQVSIEKIFFNKNVTTGISVSHARGVILLAVEQSEIPITEYTPLQLKSKVVGYGHAEKKQVQYMVKNILSLEEVPKPDDAADGLALAICYAYANRGRLYKG
ncbi:MAG: crossover junction endodeoxyribonuclease RuvC [Candidatus Cloacimonadota bacterium]|nr:MAG: crossover junction endodeoxyribonuclease RuvC [Candidatus Cloacimonadota bacterium]PCJ21030.1 MAG: crossover junction endodeoxyribonuclease RuvC [Candidatus Cloacimonadota bacterium]